MPPSWRHRSGVSRIKHCFKRGSRTVSARDIVITGLGVVSPIGVGLDAFWSSLLEGRGGVRPVTLFDASGMPVTFGAEVANFDPKEFVKPRKSLKVMSRDIQLGVSAADMACTQAGITPGSFDPDRLGVVFGSDMILCLLEDVESAYRGCRVDGKFDFNRWGSQAMTQMYPLWMLRYLPNMSACHIAIAHDARGHNNSLTMAEASSLLAVSEAVRIIERGHVDMVLVGGASSRIHPTTFVRAGISDVSRRCDQPAAASRPFDAARDGAVYGEGAAAMVLETRSHAEQRGAKIQGRVLGFASAFESRHNGTPLGGSAVRASIIGALRSAGLTPADIGHVNANGLSTICDDRVEAQAIRDVLGNVPVTAPKSFFGNIGAGTGAVEMVASVLALQENLVPITLNYEQPDPLCPVNVIHGEPHRDAPPIALLLNQAPAGQAVAVVIAAEG
jgi:3-oxoacyl-[acyl-carrier-protein] synthase II